MAAAKRPERRELLTAGILSAARGLRQLARPKESIDALATMDEVPRQLAGTPESICYVRPRELGAVHRAQGEAADNLAGQQLLAQVTNRQSRQLRFFFAARGSQQLHKPITETGLRLDRREQAETTACRACEVPALDVSSEPLKLGQRRATTQGRSYQFLELVVSRLLHTHGA
jgi:hypothetical protein